MEYSASLNQLEQGWPNLPHVRAASDRT